MKKLLASILDEIIVFGVSALLLLLTILILKIIGFVLVAGVSIIIFTCTVAGISVLYFPIVESTKLNTTVGKKLLGLK